MSNSIFVAKGKNPLNLLAAMANRHGLIAGATGTGKTVSLRVLAEGLSQMGVPVFMADVKGDLAGLSQVGSGEQKLKERATELGVQGYAPQSFPVAFWDVLAEQGHPLRATVSDMGPLLLGRLLNLNETQNGVLNIVFKAADDQGMLLLDLKDLQAMLQHVAEQSKEYSQKYGNVSAASVGAIQRGLLTISEQGADKFFGEPALDIEDLLQTDSRGLGQINIMAADKLMEFPKIYATFLLWLLSELFERLPEAGDLDKPKLVFFFDEAHLLFDEAPKILLEKIEQVVRLIRSKGVGVYFVTQNPLDVPDTVLGQLGNRIQHALRAFTPRDQKAVKAAADTFRGDGTMDVSKIITELAVGEALISFLDEKGSPSIVERGLVCPPRSRIGAINADERKKIIQGSSIFGHYEKQVDRESAYEMLKNRANNSSVASADVTTSPSSATPPQTGAPKSSRQTPIEAAFTSAARAVGSQIGRQLIRGLMGSLLGGGRRR